MVNQSKYIDVKIGGHFFPLASNPNKPGTLYLPIIYVSGLPVHYVELSYNKPSEDSLNLARVALESFKMHAGKCSVIPVSEWVADKFSKTKNVSQQSYYNSQLVNFSLSYINKSTIIERHVYSTEHIMVTFNPGTQREITFSIWDDELTRQIEGRLRALFNIK